MSASTITTAPADAYPRPRANEGFILLTGSPTAVAAGIHAFGLERIGLVALARPRFFAVLVIAMTLLCGAAALARLSFDGDINRILESSAEPYRAFQTLQRDFRRFADDEVLLIRTSGLNQADAFETLREFQLELQFIEQIDAILSVFTLVKEKETGDGWSPALPAFFDDDAVLDAALTALLIDQPTARSLIAPEDGAALLILMPGGDDGQQTGFSPMALAEIEDLLDSYETGDFEIAFVGQPAIERELVAIVKTDQIFLSVVAVLLCALIAMLIFRTPAAALVSTAPPVVALVWYLGIMAMMGVRVDFLTTIIPILVTVLAFADSLHLFFHWRRACDRGTDPDAALKAAVTTVGPACALASMTTAIAFLALTATSNRALIDMAFVGMAGSAIVFVAVILVGPLLAHYSLRRGTRYIRLDTSFLHGLGRPGGYVLSKWRKAVPPLTVLLFAGLLVAHFQMPTHYRLTDYIPADSEALAANDFIDQTFGGSGQLFAIVDRKTDDPVISREERIALARIEDVFDDMVAPDRASSLAARPRDRDRADIAIDLSALPTIADPYMSRFVSKDWAKLLITVPVPQGLSADETQALLAEIESRLTAVAPDTAITLTGEPVLRGTTMPVLIGDLRHGLMLSIIASIFVIGIALRSWRLGLACFLPNVLPILMVELQVWITQGAIGAPTAVALTIGFGLAVDDTVHLLNQYKIERAGGAVAQSAMRTALTAVSPALLATTLLLSAGLSVTFFSTLPTVNLFGGVIIAILFVALWADVFVLPSITLAVERKEAA